MCLDSGKGATTKDKVTVISELRQNYPLKDLLLLAKITKGTYYYNLNRLKCPDKYELIKEEIKRIFTAHSGRYGYRRIYMELRNEGYVINHKTVYRLMKELNLSSMVRIKKYRSYKGEVGRIANNLINRDFKASAPNQKWTTDITEFSLAGEKLYLSPILDMYNGEIISYKLCRHPNLLQVLDMLDDAFSKLPDNTNLILHSDQGWQYQNKRYQEKLKQKGVRQSMSRKGNCLDNSIMESFFGVLKSELLYMKKYPSMEEFEQDLIIYIDYYNNQRIKSKLNGMSPVQFREFKWAA